MGGSNAQAMVGRARGRAAWELAAAQHGVIGRGQLLTLGFSAREIERRLAAGRLHLTAYRGIYAVGRPGLTQIGRWLAAVRSCGDGAALSHGSAAAYWGFGSERAGLVEVSLPAICSGRGSAVRRHRRAEFLAGLTVARDIPVTSPELTVVDVSPRLSDRRLEAAISEADARGLLTPIGLRDVAAELLCVPGAVRVRRLLDRRTFRLTRSDLEREFLGLVLRAGLPVPQTRAVVNGFEVDFFWPGLGLVAETDGWTFHRTPGQQAMDTKRDHTHLGEGLTSLRFSHAQVHFDPGYVSGVLLQITARLSGGRAKSASQPPGEG